MSTTRALLTAVTAGIVAVAACGVADGQSVSDLIRAQRYDEALARCATIDPAAARDATSDVALQRALDDNMGCGTAEEHAGHLDRAFSYYWAVYPFRETNPYLLASLGDLELKRADAGTNRERRGGVKAYCSYRAATGYYSAVIAGRNAAGQVVTQPAELVKELKQIVHDTVRKEYALKKYLQENPAVDDLESWAKTGRDPFDCCPKNLPCKAIGTSALALLIQFAHASTDITGNHNAIAALAKALRVEPSARITLVGFASRRGTAQYNQRLSERRALAVRNALVELDPSLVDRISTAGRGATQPVIDPDGNEDEEMSRRVELVRN